MSSFKDYACFVHNNPEAEAQRSHEHTLSLSCNSTSNSFGLLPQGYCKRKPLNLEKTTSHVLSVLLLTYGCRGTLITAGTPYTVYRLPTKDETSCRRDSACI